MTRGCPGGRVCRSLLFPPALQTLGVCGDILGPPGKRPLPVSGGVTSKLVDHVPDSSAYADGHELYAQVTNVYNINIKIF